MTALTAISYHHDAFPLQITDPLQELKSLYNQKQQIRSTEKQRPVKVRKSCLRKRPRSSSVSVNFHEAVRVRMITKPDVATWYSLAEYSGFRTTRKNDFASFSLQKKLGSAIEDTEDRTATGLEQYLEPTQHRHHHLKAIRLLQLCESELPAPKATLAAIAVMNSTLSQEAAVARAAKLRSEVENL